MPPRPGYRPSAQTAPRPAVQPANPQPLASSFETFTWEMVALLDRSPEALAALDMSVSLGELYARYRDERRRRGSLPPAETKVQAALDALPDAPAPAAAKPEPVVAAPKPAIAPVVRRVGVMRPSVPTTAPAAVVAPAPTPAAPRPTVPLTPAAAALRQSNAAQTEALRAMAESDADDEDDLGDADAAYRPDTAAHKQDGDDDDDGWTRPFANRPASAALETGPVRGLSAPTAASDEAAVPYWLETPADIEVPAWLDVGDEPSAGPITGVDKIPAAIEARARAKRLTR